MALAQLPFGQIHYEWILPDARHTTPIVFLHEALGSIRQWKDFPLKLCKLLNTRGIIYERQGHGFSEPFNSVRKDDYLHNYALEELPAFLASIGLTEPVHLVGHSDGGSIALIYAAHYPEQVVNLVTLAAHAFVEPVTLEGIREVVPSYPNFREKLARYHPHDVDALFYAWHQTWLTDSFQYWNIEDQLHQITSQSLILQGDQDEYGSADQVARICDRIGKHASGHLISDCKHIPHLQQQEITLNLIEEFWRF